MPRISVGLAKSEENKCHTGFRNTLHETIVRKRLHAVKGLHCISKINYSDWFRVSKCKSRIFKSLQFIIVREDCRDKSEDVSGVNDALAGIGSEEWVQRSRNALVLT